MSNVSVDLSGMSGRLVLQSPEFLFLLSKFINIIQTAHQCLLRFTKSLVQMFANQHGVQGIGPIAHQLFGLACSEIPHLTSFS
jgi:hypothetical protein